MISTHSSNVEHFACCWNVLHAGSLCSTKVGFVYTIPTLFPRHDHKYPNDRILLPFLHAPTTQYVLLVLICELLQTIVPHVPIDFHVLINQPIPCRSANAPISANS